MKSADKLLKWVVRDVKKLENNNMVLYKLDDFDTDEDTSGNENIKNYDVYSSVNQEKIGTVKNIMVDETGRIRYLVVDTGFWVFGKQVLLPVGRTRIDDNARRVYAVGFTKEQAENLPEFSEELRIDRDYEERVSNVYRTEPVESSAPLPSSASLEASAPVTLPSEAMTYAPPVPGDNYNYNQVNATQDDRDTYSYDRQPSLYDMNDRDHQTLKLYEERLVANKHRMKAAEVTVGKHVETETARVAIPVEKERVIVERTTPDNARTPVAPGEADFREGEVARIEVYEETADVHKEAFVREEVRVRKEVDRDTVTAEDQIRREELDVDSQNRPVIDRTR
jgi:uncharacterized protein (TIGR02271 family)